MDMENTIESEIFRLIVVTFVLGLMTSSSLIFVANHFYSS
jgi:hypothetical protein